MDIGDRAVSSTGRNSGCRSSLISTLASFGFDGDLVGIAGSEIFTGDRSRFDGRGSGSSGGGGGGGVGGRLGGLGALSLRVGAGAAGAGGTYGAVDGPAIMLGSTYWPCG